MSDHTQIKGTITVCPLGKTDAEKEYMLKTVLNHLPTFPKGNPDITFNCYINQCKGCEERSGADEFNEYSNLCNKQGWFTTELEYMISIDAKIRFYKFDKALRTFMRWLCRLGKRTLIVDALVRIWDYDHSVTIDEKDWYIGKNPLWLMYERNDNWCDWLTPRYYDEVYLSKWLQAKLINPAT